MSDVAAAGARVLVVGGGIAGIEIATKLARSGRFRVTLVDKTLSHAWKPALHTVAAGTSSPQRQQLSFLAHAKRNGFTFRPGCLDDVDRAARRVDLAPFADLMACDRLSHASLSYDALILAVGSRANDFGTKGVAEHCLSIDDVADAERFRARLRRDVFLSLDADRSLDIAIVGGGATGVELAAELKHAIDLVAGYGPEQLRGKLRLTLLEAGPRLLPAFPAHIAEAATRTLTDLGIMVRTGAVVMQADADAFTLKDGSRVEAALKVWAAGVKAPDALSRMEGLDRSKTGQLLVTSTLRTTNDPLIFALGDCASPPVTDGGRPVPATAQAAHQQAGYLARHFADALAGRPCPPFRYRERGSLVSLSDYNGWGTFGHYAFGGGPLQGLAARWAHALLYRQHRFELLGLPLGTLDWLADKLESQVRPPVRLD